MKILVTGGKGLIGTQAVAQLQAAGHEVGIFDIKDGQDIESPSALERYFQTQGAPEVVVHLAGWPHPSTALTYRHYLNGNIVGTFNVAKLCGKVGIRRLVYSSSTAYYGYEHTIGRGTPLGDEQTIPGIRWARPRQDYLACELWYGISKVCAESILAYYGLAQVYQVVILRLCPVPHHIDLGMPPEKAAEAIRLAVEYPGELWYEVFNIAGEPGLDVSKACEVLGFDPGYQSK